MIFNKAQDIATAFTCKETLQKHLEEKLSLRPIMDNAFEIVQGHLYNGCLQPYN